MTFFYFISTIHTIKIEMKFFGGEAAYAYLNQYVLIPNSFATMPMVLYIYILNSGLKKGVDKKLHKERGELAILY